MLNSNPLLKITELPPFSDIKHNDIKPALEQTITENRDQLQNIIETNTDFSWENLVEPLQRMDNRLSNIWSPINHLHAVMNSPSLHQIYTQCLQLITEYYIEVGHNKKLYQAFNKLKNSIEYTQLNRSQKKVIDNTLRDFKLSGIDLSAEDKNKFAELEQRHAKLSNEFEQNILDTTQAWILYVDDKKDLNGLPQHALAIAQEKAKQQQRNGFMLTLDIPCVQAVMNYCDNQKIRQQLYRAYITLASDQAPHNPENDNSAVMTELLNIRLQLAQLLELDNYAQVSLATKTAASPHQVIDFLNDLAIKAKAKAVEAFSELKKFAKEHYGISTLHAWDIAYYSEKQRQHLLDFNAETLRPYFPLTQVLSNLFNIIEKLYSIKIESNSAIDTWHPDVQCFTLKESNNTIRGYLYLDLYVREHKRSGAWMAECRNRFLDRDHLQLPVAFLTCNFSPPINDDKGENHPALLTHQEVVTLFHEFGHCLHHLLTKIDYPSISGTHGVAWDAVELPSQFFENFCYQPEILASMARHYQTGEILPINLQHKLLETKKFHAGLHLVRQLLFALFDMQLHLNTSAMNKSKIQQILDKLRNDLLPFKVIKEDRFQHSFSHVFAGGYAAGYYSYLWAEVLAQDAFTRFKQEGILNLKTGQEFLHAILEKGGSQDAIDLFIDFRGREAKIDALLESYGIC